MNDSFDGSPLRPRDGAQLRILVIARISTAHQDARSLDDQDALCRGYVRNHYPGPTRFTLIQGRGSGEILDRAELAEAEAAIESEAYDLVVVEDLGRICRRNRAVDFCELCEDVGTRLIAINDAIDTARDDWRINAFFASFKHESGNKDTSRRIRRSLRHRFDQGGVVQTFPYGYFKPPGAASDADVTKVPEAEPVYEEWFRKLEGGASFAEVADWLNASGVPTGEWMRNDQWTGTKVAQVTRNPILKGVRRRNERMSRRVNKTGRRKSVKAPTEERLYREVPHLAFLEPARYDRLIAELDARNAACARGRKAGTKDSRAGVSRKRTVWPGQHVTCGVCGRLYYWGGHGQADHLMCSGAREHHCWNAATFDGADAARRLAAAILALAEALPEFDASFLARVEAAAGSRRVDRDVELRRLGAEIARLDREIGNLLDAVAAAGFSSALRGRLAEAEARRPLLAAERAEVLRLPDAAPIVPPIAELKERARLEVGSLAFDDPEFGRLMRRLVPRIEVSPHQALDGGAIVLRAEMEVNLARLLDTVGDALDGLITSVVSVDLFAPPQRVAYLDRVATLRERGQTQDAVARELGLTVTATQRAMALHRRLREAGSADPYRRLDGPPEGSGKFRRHRHPRYEFRPLECGPDQADPGGA